jgi:hypothetical protein
VLGLLWKGKALPGFTEFIMLRERVPVAEYSALAKAAGMRALPNKREERR